MPSGNRQSPVRIDVYQFARRPYPLPHVLVAVVALNTSIWLSTLILGLLAFRVCLESESMRRLENLADFIRSNTPEEPYAPTLGCPFQALEEDEVEKAAEGSVGFHGLRRAPTHDHDQFI